MNRWTRAGLVLLLRAGGGYFALLMERMVTHMGQMTDQVARISGDVASMARSVEQMSGSVGEMQRVLSQMQDSVGRMDQTIHRGSEQIQRWNPMDMLQQAVPGGQGPRP